MTTQATHVLRKQGTNVIFPYQEELANKSGMVLLTIESAKEQGLLDKRRHPVKPTATQAEVDEMKRLQEQVREMNATISELRTELATTNAVAKEDAKVAKAAKKPKAAVVDVPPPPAPEGAPVAQEASELSALLSDLKG